MRDLQPSEHPEGAARTRGVGAGEKGRISRIIFKRTYLESGARYLPETLAALGIHHNAPSHKILNGCHGLSSRTSMFVTTIVLSLPPPLPPTSPPPRASPIQPRGNWKISP